MNNLLVVNNQLHISMTIFLNSAGCTRGTMLRDTNAEAEANHQERGKERKSEAGAGGSKNIEPRTLEPVTLSIKRGLLAVSGAAASCEAYGRGNVRFG